MTETHFPRARSKCAWCVQDRSLFPWANNHSAWTLGPLRYTLSGHSLLSARLDASIMVPFTPSPTASSPLAFLLILPASLILLLFPPDLMVNILRRPPWRGSRLGLVPTLTVPQPGGVMKAAGGPPYCLPVLRFIIPATAQGSLIKTPTWPGRLCSSWIISVEGQMACVFV